jgi:hypothetical protein
MPGMGVRESRVFMMPYMIHGWRPTSVTIHPASMAMYPKGMAKTRSDSHHRFSSQCFHLKGPCKEENPQQCKEHPDCYHELEGDVSDHNRRPFITRKLFKPLHLGIEIAMCQEAQEAGNFYGMVYIFIP